MSTRKPHNDLAGYVCELKSKHPKLLGHFIIFDKNKGGDWVTGADGSRYGLIHAKPDDTFGCVICFSSLPSARAVMKDMCAGSDIGDLGQHDQEPHEVRELIASIAEANKTAKAIKRLRKLGTPDYEIAKAMELDEEDLCLI